MQKLYTLNFYAALVVLAALLLCLFWSLVSTTFIDIPLGASAIVEFSVVLAFVPLNLLYCHLNKERKLRLPRSTPTRVVEISSLSTAALFFLLMFVGFFGYMDAPIRPDKSAFIGKTGEKYTYHQYRIYRKWEFALMTAGNMATLCGIVLLPFYDKETKNHKFD